MTADQKLLDVHYLVQAMHHLLNQGPPPEFDHGYFGARPYLDAVSSETGLPERIERIWHDYSPEAARREVLRLALEISR